eukprot:TRINITY_DN1069_c0_g1::TRINITY_DN1069_c0_g1_i1::g.29918::m.29918 TRINITY_DN1069_c0_g1::TRINITY_DN1069_c0_g1_i1::g.29918  ORF type:complete len:142 (-),score=26.16,ALMT/PF11744.3/0.01,DUF2524/PF10732.4/0.11 TRINITY_DN1069_c0_g1_i1:185-610(-)
MLKDAAAICKTKMEQLIGGEAFARLDQDPSFDLVASPALLTKNYDAGVSKVNQTFDHLIKRIEEQRSKILANLEAQYSTRKQCMDFNARVYHTSKGALDKLKQDVAANVSSLTAPQSHDELNSVYLETLHLHMRLKAHEGA